MKKLLLLGTVLAASSFAFAYPTLTGPTGLATLPTAAVQPAGVFNVAADFYNIADDATSADDAIPIRATYGVAENLEVGAAFILNANGSDDAWDLNAKYKTPLTVGGFDWALGAQYLNINTDPDNVTATQAYLAGTRALGGGEGMPAINGTIGVNWTTEDFGSDNVDAIRAFLGLDVAFTNKLTVAGEFQTKDSDLDSEALWSVVARYPFTPALGAQLGFTNGPIDGSDESNFFVGLNYAFGGAEEE